MKTLFINLISAFLLYSIFFLPTVAISEEENAEVKTETIIEQPPLPETKKEDEGAYRISKGDTLQIEVYEEEDLTGEFRVKEDGKISYPLLGTVEVLGLSEAMAEERIFTLLEKDYLVSPHVEITVKDYHERVTLVLGSLNRPGSYPFPEDRPLTLLEAVSLAGGFSRYASPSGTRITRTLPSGEKKVLNPRVKDIINGRIEDIELAPGDIVSVPERFF